MKSAKQTNIWIEAPVWTLAYDNDGNVICLSDRPLTRWFRFVFQSRDKGVLESADVTPLKRLKQKRMSNSSPAAPIWKK